jgi:hypothetical protein
MKISRATNGRRVDSEEISKNQKNRKEEGEEDD